jgi:SSS family solute:Na+ symporter
MNTGILIAVLIYEVVLILGVGLWIARREANQPKHEGDFALAGRNLPVPVVAITLALTVLGTAHILGVFEMTWGVGASAVWFSIAHVILLVVVCLSTGLWVRRLGLTTVPEILEMLYGPATRLFVSCTMAGVIFGILTIETQGIGIIFASMTGWEIKNGAIVGGMLGICYVVLAGMKEVGWLNLVNGVVMYVGLILAVIFVALALPGNDYSTIMEHYNTPEEVHKLSIYGTPGIFFTFSLGFVVSVVFSQSINQMLMQPCMSAASEETIRKALWWAAPINGLFGVFAVVLGLTAAALPEFAALGPKVATTSMLIGLLPGWLSAVLLASFLAAILSTFAMTSLAPATIVTVDIYKNLYRPNASEKELTLVMRVMIIGLALIAMAVAASLPPILAAMNWLFSWLVPIFWIIMFGLFWKRNTKVAMATLICAWIANSAWSFTSISSAIGWPADINPYITLLVTLVVGITGNLIMKGEPGFFKSDEYRARVAQQVAAEA